MARLNPRQWIYLLLHVVVFMGGVLLVQQSGAVMSGVGASLIATAIAGWVLFVWVLVNQAQANRLEMVARIGLVDAYPGRSTRIKEQYDTRLAGARQSIDIMGFGLRQLREDYLNDFSGWATRAHVRILMVDPDAPAKDCGHSLQRDIEEGNPIGAIASEVREFLLQTTELRAQNPERFQIRLYQALPSINIFRVDDELFWGPYLIRTQSRNTPTFLVQRGGLLFERFTEHFDALWTDERFSREPE